MYVHIERERGVHLALELRDVDAVRDVHVPERVGVEPEADQPA